MTITKRILHTLFSWKLVMIYHCFKIKNNKTILTTLDQVIHSNRNQHHPQLAILFVNIIIIFYSIYKLSTKMHIIFNYNNERTTNSIIIFKMIYLSERSIFLSSFLAIITYFYIDCWTQYLLIYLKTTWNAIYCINLY